MSREHGGKHGAFGFVSVALVIKLILKKSLFFAHDIVIHQLLKAPIELLLVELPFSLFRLVGAAVLAITNIQIPPVAAGLIVVYPLLVASIVAITEHPSPRMVGSYWLGTTIITTVAVVASLGMIPDPVGIGSGLVYYIVHHTAAEFLRTAVLELGSAIGVIGRFVGVEIEQTVGLLLAITVVAICYGILWERHIGHE
jgi:hypothetical protein